MPPFLTSLSARLLVLTVFFVMVAEVLIYAPTIGRYRLSLLNEKLATAHLAALAVVEAPNNMVTDEIERELLDHVMAYRIFLNRPGEQMYALGMLPPRAVSHVIDMEAPRFFGAIADAFETLANGEGRVSRVVGPSPRDPDVTIEVIFDETSVRTSMVAYSWRILGLSIVISLMTAGLVFVSLRWLTVRPLERITDSLERFRRTPEAEGAIIRPGRRNDEVGIAERELRRMQVALKAALQQKTRLAALGTAVTKISHDLRNMLSAASLVSESLTASGDPATRKVASRLLKSIDQATDLCRQTLAYAREGGISLCLAPVPLRDLVDACQADLDGVALRQTEGQHWINNVPPNLVISADGAQLARVFVNLGSNAFQAGAEHVEVTARLEGEQITVEILDDGPGLPPRARSNLFQPFTGSARPGGTGLGLAIAREIVVGHSGDIALVSSSEQGTLFRLRLPAHRGGSASKRRTTTNTPSGDD